MSFSSLTFPAINMGSGKDIAQLTTMLPAIVFALGTVTISFLVYRFARDRVFHPLRKFPGPFFNSVSNIPCAWVLYNGGQHKYYKSLHDKYGPVVRVAPDELSFTSAEAWEGIYGFQKDGPNFEKSPIFIGAVSPKDGFTGISLAPNEMHKRQRKALAPPFTNNALLQQQPILQKHVDKFMAALKQMTAKGQEVNFSNWYTYTTFDMIGDICFAEPFGCLDEASNNEWSTAIINVFKSASWDQGIRRVAGVGSPLHKLLVKFLIPAEAAKWRMTHFANSQAKTLARLADPDREHKDLIYHLLKSQEDGKKASLTHMEICLNMVLFISAGSETTASLLTGWTYFMATHPEVLARVTAEVRTAFNSSEDINWHTVGELEYLDATMHEALRLFSPAPANQQRMVPPAGATIAGHYVPGGYTVAVAPWAATRSATNFADAHRYDPERWLPGKGNGKYADDKLHSSQPFSLGQRGCIGKNLSFFEMRLILANLLWNFDLKMGSSAEALAAKKRWDEHDMLVYQTWMKPDLFIGLKDIRA